MIPLLLALSAAAAPVSLERVDLLSEDPGTWLNYEAPQLQLATADMAAVRFVAQLKPVFTTPVQGLYVGTSLTSQSLVYESPLSEGPDIYVTAGLQTRLLLPAGVLMGVAWRGGPLRVGLSVSMLSEATWVRPSWSSWTVMPSLGLGIVRKAHRPE